MVATIARVLHHSTDAKMKPEYNDNTSEFDAATLERLTSNGVDETLAKHLAYLWTRDPLVIFSEHAPLRRIETPPHSLRRVRRVRRVKSKIDEILNMMRVPLPYREEDAYDT